ncbi:hypothetical protein NE857_09755 [Nocardiopsis exhalans]|uniref:Uncharacterized protein n=1 Tax=Nocardiopsis exhalans TaxID=163604 RepID=A0ABY5DEQ9_9ACTN|nr:hypothetical protein [Nocardiopsis exhalans]USY21864.1 hypothetical protein NE857_09755 [Nocardiopsis exhalans]
MRVCGFREPHTEDSSEHTTRGREEVPADIHAAALVPGDISPFTVPLGPEGPTAVQLLARLTGG